MRRIALAAAVVAMSVAGALAQSTPRPSDVARELLDALERGDAVAASASFTAEMKKGLPPAVLSHVWSGLVAQAGELRERGEMAITEVGGNRLVAWTLEFEKVELAMKVTVNGTGQVAGLVFAPVEQVRERAVPPADAPFVEHEVTIGAGAGALPGTLTLPRGEGPFPGVVLVHGSGPHDRDESIGPNKPFRDLAWGLASRGVAALRYDKRTLAHAGAMAATIATLTVREETVSDAVLALDTLASRPEIDGGRVVLAGHSLGAMLVPRIAARSPHIAAAIVLAPPGRPLQTVVVEQTEYLAGLDGEVDDGEAQVIRAVTIQARFLEHGDISEKTPAGMLPLGLPAAYWLDLAGYDCAREAAAMPQPMFIARGGRDYQVTDVDLAAWRTAFAERRNVTFRTYPELNHLFIAGEGQPGPAEYEVEGRVSEQLLDDLTKFIAGLRGSRASSR